MCLSGYISGHTPNTERSHMKKEKEGQKEFESTVERKDARNKKSTGKDLKWEKPVLEDVSGQVMAQPYIRFT